MKRKLLSILICVNIVGCANIETNDVVDKKDVIEENQEKDLFYNAFVGNIMEKEGKNNNAITYYENILKVQYDKNYFNKLIELYLYKNDFISARNLIKNTELINIQKNHSMFEITFHISNNNDKQAIQLLNDQVETIKEKNKTPIFTLSQYYNNFSKTYLFFFQDYKEESTFFNLLKSSNNSQYNLINHYYKENEEKTLITYDLKDFKNDELTIAKIKKFIESKDKDMFLDIIKDENLNKIEKNELLNLFYADLNNKYEFIETLKYIKKAELNGIEKSQKTIYNQFISYFATFENNDALYTLDLIKDDVNKDFYFYYKAISNYRLGYKNAAKKYMVHVSDSKVILQDPLVYIDIIGTNSVFTSSIFSDKDDVEKNFLLFKYYIKKKNQKEAQFYFTSINEVINETGSRNDYELLIKESNNMITDLFDKKKLISISKEEYENDTSINSANSYLYALLSSDYYNSNIADLIYESFKTEFDSNPSYLDTKAMYLLKGGNAIDALNVYKDNKLLFFADVEIQENISKVYKKLGNKEEALKHTKYSKSLFNK